MATAATAPRAATSIEVEDGARLFSSCLGTAVPGMASSLDSQLGLTRVCRILDIVVAPGTRYGRLVLPKKPSRAGYLLHANLVSCAAVTGVCQQGASMMPQQPGPTVTSVAIPQPTAPISWECLLGTTEQCGSAGLHGGMCSAYHFISRLHKVWSKLLHWHELIHGDTGPLRLPACHMIRNWPLVLLEA